MKHLTSSRSWQKFDAPPFDVQRLARRHYALLKQDPTPPQHFNPVRSGQFHSVRIGLHYRALGIPVPEGIQWFWIGTHTEYDHLLSS